MAKIEFFFCFYLLTAYMKDQMLSLADEYTILLNFLIIGFCNSSGNCWFSMLYFLIAPLDVSAFF